MYALSKKKGVGHALDGSFCLTLIDGRGLLYCTSGGGGSKFVVTVGYNRENTAWEDMIQPLPFVQ